MATIPASSVEYLHVPVTADVTLDTQTVEIAITASSASPESTTTWHAATWEGTAGTTRTARLLIGPGQTVEVAKGSHAVWVRVSDTPEVPVRKAGDLKAT